MDMRPLNAAKYRMAGIRVALAAPGAQGTCRERSRGPAAATPERKNAGPFGPAGCKSRKKKRRTLRSGRL